MFKHTPLYEWTVFTEADRRDFMTKEEKALRYKLVKLLQDDGRGHHHAAYAKRLAKFDINIVPLGEKPETAAISFDEGVIYINRGFLTSENTFYQLNVIMRHELCHNLLMHQFRMIKKLEKIIPEEHLTTSSSLHELLNTLEDFEISNRAYSDEDKNVVRNTWLNGKLISGLVTEDHRESWLYKSLETMYDAIEAEIEAHGNTGDVDVELDVNKQLKGQNLNVAAAKLHMYKDIDSNSDFDSLEQFKKSILAPALRYDKGAKLPEVWQNIFDSIQKDIVDDPVNEYTNKDIEEMLQTIAKSKALRSCEVNSPVTKKLLFTLYTPEEKAIAVECLKIIGGKSAYWEDYRKWYYEIVRKLYKSEYTEDQIKELADLLK